LSKAGLRPHAAAFGVACAFVFAGTLGAQSLRQDAVLPDAPLPAEVRAENANALANALYAAVTMQDEGVSSSQQAPATPQTIDQHGEPVPPPTKVRPQQQRVFGVLPNYNSVSGGGVKFAQPGWKTDFKIATHQSYDYVGNIYGVATSAIAYAQDSHPSLDTVNGGNAPFWAYTWRGFVDRTDGSFQGTFFFPALLHEDVRYFAKGEGSITKRTLNAVGSVVIAHSYSGRRIPNIAGILGKVGTQAMSTTYYPSGSEDFGVLATKFTYACLRQAGFTVLREFSPDIAVHLHRHKKTQQPTATTPTAP
jgi:hypothetical protein